MELLLGTTVKAVRPAVRPLPLRPACQDFPRTAVVTGAESGIGRATAVALAEIGCDVGITWYEEESAGRRTLTRSRAWAGEASCDPST